MKRTNLAWAALMVLCACTTQPQMPPTATTLPGDPAQIDAQTRTRLATRIKAVNFAGAKLPDVIALLRKATGANFAINQKALADAGVGLDAPVNMELSDVPAETVLKMALRQLATADRQNPVCFAVLDGVVTISTRQDLSGITETRLYDIRALLDQAPNFTTNMAWPESDAYGRPEPPAQALQSGCVFGPPGSPATRTREESLNAIKSLIYNSVGQHGDWVEMGGKLSSLAEANGRLVIRTTSDNHLQVRKLLDLLEESAGHMVAVEMRILVVKTTVAEKALGLGKGQLILDAQGADAFLTALLKPEAGAISLATNRLVCRDGQNVFATADHPTVYLESGAPTPGTEGATAAADAAHAGVLFDICPRLGIDHKAIDLAFKYDVCSAALLRQTSVPVNSGGAGPARGIIGGQVTVKAATQPGDANKPMEGTISGVITPRPPGSGVAGTMTLELPEQDWIHFGSAVRIPDNGAAVFAASARTLQTLAGNDMEVILFLSAQVGQLRMPWCPPQPLSHDGVSIMKRLVPILAVLAGLWFCTVNAAAQSPAAGDAENQVDAQTRAKLATPIPTVKLAGAKLQDVVDFLHKATGANFDIDEPVLKDAAADLGATIDLELSDVPAETVLKMTLGRIHTSDDTNPAAFTVIDGIVTISTRRKLDKITDLRVYDVAVILDRVPDFRSDFTWPEFNLCPYTGSMGAPGLAPTALGKHVSSGLSRDDMLRNIKSLIYGNVGDSTDWADNGGVVSWLWECDGSLFIRTTPDNHVQLQTLLAQLERTASRTVAVEARVLVVKTTVADPTLRLGKGQLILDSKAADAFLDTLLKPETGAQSLGISRTVCHSGQSVFALADHATMHVEQSTPVVATESVTPTMGPVHAGVLLDIWPTLNTDNTGLKLVFACDVSSPTLIRQMAVPVIGGGLTPPGAGDSTIDGKVTLNPPAAPTTGPTAGAAQPVLLEGTLTGSVNAPKQAQRNPTAAVNLELPEQDWVHFSSAVRIPDNGAAVFAASARSIQGFAPRGTEVILFLRAKAAN